jgi:glycosyltransferase involved in cell wall biosynthesis
MRIGIDASNIRCGGAITHLAEIIRHGDPIAHGIRRVTIWGASLVLDRIPDRPWLERVHVPLLEGRLPMRVAWQLLIRPRLARASCDLMFAPGATPPGTFRPYVSMHQNMLPFVDAERTRYPFGRHRLRLELLRLLQGHAFEQSTAVIYLSVSAHDRMPHSNGNGHIIPHGVGEHFRHAPRPARPIESHTTDDPFRFVYVSPINLYKHQWNVALAVLQLRREGLPVVLELIGPVDSLRAQKRLDTTLASVGKERDAIRLLGSIPHGDLSPIYDTAGAFVFASTCENLPVTLLEAMACGLPVAASQTQPMPEILGNGGTYFDAESVESIATALRRLALDRDLRARSAQIAHERAAAYSWKRSAELTFALLAKVAGDGRKG